MSEEKGSAPALYEIDGEGASVTTLEDFIACNTQDGYCAFDDEEIAVFRALAVGETHIQNDGASGTWTIRRIA